MDVHNISVCVAPSIFHKIDKPSDVETNFKSIAFVEFMIKNLVELFGADTLSLLSKEPPQIVIEINSDTSSQVSKSNESICTKTKPRRDLSKVLNLVNFKSKQSLIAQKSKIKAYECQKTQSIGDINDLLSNSGSLLSSNSEPKQRASTAFTSNENVFASSNQEFIFDEDVSSVYEASTDDDDDDEEEDDDEDIVCETKKTQLFTKRNLFKIKSNSKNFQKSKTNKHDVSSNTLSVDSGLSVPTTTNSDPESEKSASLKKPDEVQLKRQKRMIALLNTDNNKDKIEDNICYDLTDEAKNEQLMEMFMRQSSKRFSLKSMAPLAPHKSSNETHEYHSLPVGHSKSTVTDCKRPENKTLVKVHASRKSMVKVSMHPNAIENDVFKNAVMAGRGHLANMIAEESPKRRHSSMVYVSGLAGQIQHRLSPSAYINENNSKNLVANLFNQEETSPVRCLIKRSLSLKTNENDLDQIKCLKIPVACYKNRVESSKTNRVSIVSFAEESTNVHRLSMDANTCTRIKNMDDNNNDSSSRNKCLNELELAGVTWSVPNIRKQFERANEAKRVESYVTGRRKTINIEAGLAEKNRLIAHRATYI